MAMASVPYQPGRPAAAPPLRWQAFIDWPGDGNWSAPGVDVSSQLAGLSWRWGRTGLPTPEFAPPAALELTLHNADDRYTPGNPASPLAGLVQPGRAVRLQAARLADDFSLSPADAPPTLSRTLDGRLAPHGDARWQVLSAGSAGFAIRRDGVAGQSGSERPSDAVALLDTGDPTASLLARFRRAGNGQGGFVLRCAARDDCLRLRFSNSATLLERVSGPRTAALAAGPALAPRVWHWLEIVQTADSVALYATNLQTPDARCRELIAARVDHAPDSGRHGLWTAFRNTADRWGAFSVGRSLFQGRIGSITPDPSARLCRIAAQDASRTLDDIRLFRSLAGGQLHSGSVAAAILDWAGFSPSQYAVDAGRLLSTGAPRSVWNLTAGAALRQLQREENGFLFADGLGRIRLESAAVRAARRTSGPTAAAGRSLAGAPDDIHPFITALRRDDNADAVEHPVTFRYRRPTDYGRQRIWRLNEPLPVIPGVPGLTLAATDDWDAVQGLETPAPGADYQATDRAAGDGVDLTNHISVAVVAEAASGIAGRGALLRITNAGAQTAYLHRLDLYAAHCWRADGATAHRAAADPPPDAPAAARIVNCRYIDHYPAAQAAAEARYAERSVRRPALALTLPLTGAANPPAILEARLSDVIAAAPDAPPGLAGAWFLEGIVVEAHAGAMPTAHWWLTQA